MKRSTLIGILLALVAGGAVLFLWPKEELTPEELIRRKVLQMAAAAEEKDLAFIMDQISEGFRGSPQSLGKDDLKRFLAAQLLRGTWVKVFVRDVQVELSSGTEARFEGKFIFGRSEAQTVEQLAAQSQIQGYRVTGTLEHEPDGEWRFVTGGYYAIQPGQLF